MGDTIFSAYNKTKNQLEAIDGCEYVFEAKQIIKHITGYTNRETLEKFMQTLTPVQENRLSEIIEKRKMRYPLQYILGRWDFYGLPFAVGPGVLIPRADTETLVEKTLERIIDIKNPCVLDLCTGSGAVAVAVAKNRPDAEVVAVEKYDGALAYAKKNIEQNGADNVTLIKGDIFEAAAADGKYDMILSNPPYITDDEMKDLQPEVAFEPETALAGGKDGLDFYRAIIKNYKNSLKENGALAFEIGATKAQNGIPDLMREAGLRDIKTALDIEERQRVVFGTYKNI